MKSFEKLKNPGRVAGGIYLLIILFGVFAEMFVRGKLIVEGDASKTASNILNNESLFRLGFVSDLLMAMSFFALGLVLYFVFKEVNQKVSLIMLALNILGTGIMALNMLNQFGALVVLTSGSYMNVFSQEQLEALSYLLLNFHEVGYDIGIISFGTWLFPIGYLVIKSGYMPKVIGVFLMLGAIGYDLYLIINYTLPQYGGIAEMLELVPSSIGEFSFCLWLIFIGIKREKIERFSSKHKITTHQPSV